jgi:hypothetical protein
MNTTCCLLLLGGLIMGGGAGWIARARRRAAERMERVRRVAYATKRDVWAQLYADTPTIGPHPMAGAGLSGHLAPRAGRLDAAGASDWLMPMRR